MQLRVPQPDVTFAPHPEGIFPAVCVDVIDMGMMSVEQQGGNTRVHKVRLVFETDQVKQDGTRFVVARMFTASLHPKGRLAQTLEKWRGQPFQPDEVLDLNRLIGVSCTLVVSHVLRADGTVFASIDAITKAAMTLAPSRNYDPKAARDRIVAAGGVRRAPLAKPAPAAPQPGRLPGE